MAVVLAAVPRNPRIRPADSADAPREEKQKASSIALAGCSPPRIRDPRSPRNPRTEGPDWSALELDGLVDELARACEDAGKPTITHRVGLVDALASHPRDHILSAVRRLASEVRAGSPLRMPFAALVKGLFSTEPGNAGIGPVVSIHR